MQKIKKFISQKSVALVCAVTIVLAVSSETRAFAQSVSGQTNESKATALLERHTALLEQLSQNQYRRPLFLESVESAGTVSSTAYAVLDTPFSTVSATFKKPNNWCEVLILHINTKYCKATTNDRPSTLTVNIGKKTPQLLSDAFQLQFSYRLIADTSNYLAVQLHADDGPLSTTDYQLVLQAAPLPEGKTFINFRYSYDYGLAGRMAMQAYLSTIGRGKVGFSKKSSDPGSAYIGGMRGTIERNTMRYFLAIEAYLESLKQPPAEQFNTRLQYWFDATEQYPQQLHEVDRSSYLEMKKAEYHRQRAADLAPGFRTP